MRASRILFLAVVGVFAPVPGPAVPVEPTVEYETSVLEKSGTRTPRVPAFGDTQWVADWTFDGPGGTCDDTGWVRYDNRVLNDGSNYWSVDSRFDGTGGITGKAAVLSKHDLTWPCDGYGNNWDYSVVLEYQGTGSTLTFSLLADSEPSYDFVSVEADSAGASESRVDYGVDPTAVPSSFRQVLLSMDGVQNATLGPIALPDFGVPGTTHEVYVRFASDVGYSDEDGQYCSTWSAGLVVDNVTITGGLAYAEDFEAALDPHVALLNTTPATPFGEWARLYSHVTDNDACAENSTCAWVWTDPTLLASTPDMAFGPGGAVIRNWLDDIIVSPWISVSGITAPGITVLSYRHFRGNDYAKGRIVQNWSVRALVRIDNTDTSVVGDSIDVIGSWQHAFNWTSLTEFKWTTAIADMTPHIDAGANAIQVRFRVSDWQYIYGEAPPATLDPGPGPYVDRVRIGRVTYPGPSFGSPPSSDVPSNYAAEDGFSSMLVASTPAEDFEPTTDRFGTVDFAPSSISLEDHYPNTAWEYNSKDSLVVYVRDVRGVGVTSVTFHGAVVAGPHTGKAPPPWTVGGNGFFQVPADSARNPYSGSVIPDNWFVDLDDDYFRGGDVLVYFFAATDAAGGFTSLPEGLTGVPSSIDVAQAATGGLLEVHNLPAIDWDPSYLARVAADPSGKLDPTPAEIANSSQRTCILYYRQQNPPRRSGDAHRTAFMTTLDQLGYRGHYDSYFQTTFFFNYSTHLAGRATPEQATGYSLVIQDAGSLYGYLLMPPGAIREGVIDQQTWYQDWLVQASTSEAGRAALWLVGDNFVDDALIFTNPVVLTDMGVTQASASQSLLPSPDITGETGFVWADGDSVEFTGDVITLDASTCEFQDNDGLGATGTAVVTHRFTKGTTTGDGAVVMNANAAASWNTILMSFTWGDLIDVPGTPPGHRRADLMAKVLDGVLPGGCLQTPQPTDVPDPGAVAALPAVTALHPNVPNPFNPATTIRFDLAHGGRVRLEIFDVGGRRVRMLVDAWFEAGWGHRAIWNGFDDDGARVASGIYLYRLVTADGRTARKMVVLK